MKPLILFRVDASSAIGTGHLYRCLEFARRLRCERFTSVFATKKLPGNLNAIIMKEGFKVETFSEDYSEYALFAQLYTIYTPYLTVIDHYSIDITVERHIKETLKQPLFVIDDLCTPHHCDILYNHNIYATSHLYEGLVPQAAKVYADSRYFLLREAFIKKKPQTKEYAIIAMGGSDPDNITQKVIECLDDSHFKLPVIVIAGKSNRHIKSLKQTLQHKKNFVLLIAPSDYEEIVAKCKFAIIASGQSAVEMIYLKKQLLVITTADNQQQMSAFIKKQKIAIVLNASFTKLVLRRSVSRLMSNTLYKQNSARYSYFIGSKNIAKEISIAAYRHFNIVYTKEADLLDTYNLANDTLVRKNSFNSTTISLDEHTSWLKQHINNPDFIFFTVQDAAKRFMGLIRFSNVQTKHSTISISLIKGARGLGLSSEIITTGCQHFFSTCAQGTVLANIKKSNTASLRAFYKAGFTDYKTFDDHVQLILRSVQ